jgi:hypothetical protein
VESHPHGSIHSWKDFCVQLGTIAAGALIALSLEGVRELPAGARPPLGHPDLRWSLAA